MQRAIFSWQLVVRCVGSFFPLCVCALLFFFSYKVREEISEKTAGAEPSAVPNPSEYRHTGSRPLAQRLTLRLGSEEKRKGGGGGGGWGEGQLLVAIPRCYSRDTREFIGHLTGWKTRPRCCPSGCWRRRPSRICFYDAIQSLRLKVFVSLRGKSQRLRAAEAKEQGTDACVWGQRHPRGCAFPLKDNNNNCRMR